MHGAHLITHFTWRRQSLSLCLLPDCILLGFSKGCLQQRRNAKLPTCSPGAADALDCALNGLVPGHGQVEHHGRRARCVSAAQAPASARSPGWLLRCTCEHVSGMCTHGIRGVLAAVTQRTCHTPSSTPQSGFLHIIVTQIMRNRFQAIS